MTEEDDRRLARRLSGQSEYTFSHDPTNALPTSYQSGMLKPCPFCGEQVTLHAPRPNELNYSPYIRCGCNVEIWGASIEDVIERWNRRA